MKKILKWNKKSISHGINKEMLGSSISNEHGEAHTVVNTGLLVYKTMESVTHLQPSSASMASEIQPLLYHSISVP